MNERIAGKVVLLTGGGTGIGAETARLLASQGAIVAVAGRRKDKLDAVVAEIEMAGGRARSYELDVTRRTQVQDVVAAVNADFGRLDVLINNAGLMHIRFMAEGNADEWDAMIDVNFKGTLHGIAAALPLFLKQESGHIINMSSISGFKVALGGAVYSGTKFAVRAICEGLRQEVGPKIRVTCIAPGYVDTDLKLGTTGMAQGAVMQLYQSAIPASAVARAIAYAIEQPAEVDINEIVLRPTSEDF